MAIIIHNTFTGKYISDYDEFDGLRVYWTKDKNKAMRFCGGFPASTFKYYFAAKKAEGHKFRKEEVKE